MGSCILDWHLPGHLKAPSLHQSRSKAKRVARRRVLCGDPKDVAKLHRFPFGPFARHGCYAKRLDDMLSCGPSSLSNLVVYGGVFAGVWVADIRRSRKL